MRKLVAAGWLIGVLGVEGGEPRFWRLGDQMIEGEFVRATAKNLTVRGADGEVLRLPLARLDEGARAWVEAAEAAAEKARSAAVPGAILKRLVKLEGGDLKRYDLEAAKGVPDYYVVYFSVSW